MLQQMLTGSRAVLLHPSVATFEEHERNNMGWATLYVAAGAIIAAALGWVEHTVQAPFREQQLQDLQRQFAQLESELGRSLPIEQFLVPRDASTPIVFNALSALIGFLLFVVVIYLLGRLFGGTGKIGELAYDVSLYWVPIAILTSLLNIVSIGWVSCITAPLSIMLVVYNLYLTYLSVRSGMNLTPERGLFVIILPVVLVVLLCCGLFTLVVLLSGAGN